MAQLNNLDRRSAISSHLYTHIIFLASVEPTKI